MKRILILGPSGSGKTTLAEKIGHILQIPVIHLDQHYWTAGWIETPKNEWHQKVRNLIFGDSWVMDGNYTSTLVMRSKAADTMIFIRSPRRLSYLRAFQRIFRNYGRNRPDLPEGCPERIDIEFLKYIWNYPRAKGPQILNFLERLQTEKKIYILSNRHEVERFLIFLKNNNNFSLSNLEKTS